MKKINLVFINVFVISTICAQPDFTSADMPSIESLDTLLAIKNPIITNNIAAETGNGYTWDFSLLSFNTQIAINFYPPL